MSEILFIWIHELPHYHTLHYIKMEKQYLWVSLSVCIKDIAAVKIEQDIGWLNLLLDKSMVHSSFEVVFHLTVNCVKNWQ